MVRLSLVLVHTNRKFDTTLTRLQRIASSNSARLDAMALASTISLELIRSGLESAWRHSKSDTMPRALKTHEAVNVLRHEAFVRPDARVHLAVASGHPVPEFSSRQCQSTANSNGAACQEG